MTDEKNERAPRRVWVCPDCKDLDAGGWVWENVDPTVGPVPTVIPTPSFAEFSKKALAVAWETLDAMPEKIEPALSAEEWTVVRDLKERGERADGAPMMVATEDFSSAGMIAAHNYLLPDSDPRKITREKIAAMRELVSYIDAPHEAAVRLARINGIDDPAEDLSTVEAGRWLWRFADALESYLPPESP